MNRARAVSTVEPAMAGPHARRRGLLAAVAARAEAWLLEPETPRPRAAEPRTGVRPVVAVVGLGERCGTTTIARALAIELARRDSGGAAFVSGTSRGGAPSLATAGARRLARGLSAEAGAAVGRLCLVDPDDPALRELCGSRPAPVVLDVGHGTPPQTAAALADDVVLVADADVEPALADAVRASLARDDRVPFLVLNRAADPGLWGNRVPVAVGDVRLGARLATAGRDPTPGLARPVAELADALLGEGQR